MRPAALLRGAIVYPIKPDEILPRFFALARSSCAPETAARIDGAVFDLVKKAHKEAREILEAHREKMDELAQYLLKKETITGDEFMAILHGTMEQAEPETVETTAVPETAQVEQGQEPEA